MTLFNRALDFLYARQIIFGMLGAACLFVPWNRPKKYFPPRLILGTVLLLVLLDHIPSIPVPLTLLLDTALLVLLIWACFDCGVLHAVFSATCAYAVQHITSKLTFMLVVWLAFRPGANQIRPGYTLLLLLLANALVCAPIFLGFTRRFFREGELRFDSIKTVIYSGLFLFVAVFLSYFLESNLEQAFTSYLPNYLALNAFCILFAGAVLSMEFSNCSIKRLENENRILAQLLESDRQQYEQAKRDMEKINIRYHDLKQQYSRASEAERVQLEAEMQALNLRYYTGNKALDILLTQKARVCEGAGIQLLCSVDGSCLSGMTHYHIYSLLGNALDNAVECLTKVDDRQKKVIHLSVSRYADMAVICVENYTPAPPVLHDGVLVTTKQDSAGHGYGMKSIKNIAALYGGTADYFVEDEVFYLLVTVPCAEAQDGTAAG